MDIDRTHDCFGTYEYSIKSLICRRCIDYVECGKIEKKFPRRRNKNLHLERKEDEVGKV